MTVETRRGKTSALSGVLPDLCVVFRGDRDMKTKCANALCGQVIDTKTDSHVKADVVGADVFWCSSDCYRDWNTQNMIFTDAADPFCHRRRTYSEKRPRV